jgi:hypothetical protein
LTKKLAKKNRQKNNEKARRASVYTNIQ